MGVFTASVVTAVQNRINTQGVNATTMGLNQALTYIQAIEPPAVTVLTGGVVTVAGNGLTNSQYQQLYEMLF